MFRVAVENHWNTVRTLRFVAKETCTSNYGCKGKGNIKRYKMASNISYLLAQVISYHSLYKSM